MQKKGKGLKQLQCMVMLVLTYGSIMLGTGRKLTIRDLQSAIHSNNTSKTKRILQYGIHPDTELQGKNLYLLHWAIESASSKIAFLLIDYGALLGQNRKKDNYSPLHCAAKHGRVDIIERLLEKGVSTRDINYTTPLHVACWFGHTRAVECLIKHGAYINVLDKNNSTPLNYACMRSHASVIQCLLKYNADISKGQNYDTIMPSQRDKERNDRCGALIGDICVGAIVLFSILAFNEKFL